ncbi:MAG: DUF4234 domain-containing protein [Actinomycetota bacterium]
MAEPVKIGGETYARRTPLDVLLLSIMTLGIYAFYWYYKVNDEIRRFERDETINPARSLLAITVGWLLLAPPFIAMSNTAKHIQEMEGRVGIQRRVMPALIIAVMLFLYPLAVIPVAIYLQEHINRVWNRAMRATPSPGARVARGRRAPKRKKRRG